MDIFDRVYDLGDVLDADGAVGWSSDAGGLRCDGGAWCGEGRFGCCGGCGCGRGGDSDRSCAGGGGQAAGRCSPVDRATIGGDDQRLIGVRAEELIGGGDLDPLAVVVQVSRRLIDVDRGDGGANGL